MKPLGSGSSEEAHSRTGRLGVSGFRMDFGLVEEEFEPPEGRIPDSSVRSMHGEGYHGRYEDSRSGRMQNIKYQNTVRPSRLSKPFETISHIIVT